MPKALIELTKYIFLFSNYYYNVKIKQTCVIKTNTHSPGMYIIQRNINSDVQIGIVIILNSMTLFPFIAHDVDKWLIFSMFMMEMRCFGLIQPC